MVYEKNHKYWAEIARLVRQKQENAYFLLVGDGMLRREIEDTFARCGIGDRTIFTGERSDIARMLQAMDVFLFPSISEGFGIAVVEAQAVGLPCVVSDTVPQETVIIESQVARLPLSASPDVWSDHVIRMAHSSRQSNHAYAWNQVNESRFSLNKTIGALSEIYLGNADVGGGSVQ
jgi:glycosyltransferase involved in cell wall biosynthesis